MSTFIRILTIGLLVVGTIAATARTVTVLHNNQVVRDEIALQQSLDAPISSDASGGAQDTSILSQVGSHATAANCWVIVSGKVYDVTKLLNTHSGGAGAITPFCGKDATQQFTTKGGGGSHSQNAHNVLTTYYIAPAGSSGGSAGQKTPSASTQPATGLRSGSSIQVSNAGMLNVRKTANGSLVGQQKPGAIGKIIGGPVTLGGYTWWNIDFGSGVDGWGAQAFLQNPGQSTSVAPTTPATPPVSTPAGATYTTVQVATHSTSGNCYVIISGKVYNVTRLISSHSGGAGAITPFCGKDATTQFQTKGGGGSHSTGAYNTLATYFVGAIAAPLVADTTTPSTPTNLTASAISDKQTNLSWSASTDNVGVTGYKIFRGGAQVGTSMAPAYTDTGRTANTTYSYTVQAYDAAGNVSAQSAAKSVTTPAATVVPPPGTTFTLSQVITHSSSGDCWVIISNKVYNVTGLLSTHSGGGPAIIPACGTEATVYFTTKNGGGSHLQSSVNTLTTYYVGDYAATQSTFTLGITKAGTGSGTVTSSGGSINCGATCSITATAGLPATLTATPAAGSIFGGWSGVSGCTSSVTCTFTLSVNTSLTATFTLSTDTTAPTVPTGLTASAISSSAVSLSWSASTDATGVTGYNVYRGGTKITTVTGTSYTDSGLSASTAYSYTVSAYDAAGNTSAQTAAKSATTPAATTGGTITLADVATHTTSTNCWLVISNKIYNVTGFLSKHSGGSSKITPACGTEATQYFNTKNGQGSHQTGDLSKLTTYWVADLGTTPPPPPPPGNTTTYNLTVTSTNGTVTSNPVVISCGATCSSSFDAGTSVTLSATPNTGYTFTGWSGGCTGTGVCNVTMNANQNVTASFTASGGGPVAPVTYTINVNSANTFSLSSLTLHIGDKIKFVYTSGSGEAQISFTPSTVTGFTLDSENTNYTRTFNTAGTYTAKNGLNGNQLTITVQ